MSKFTLVSNFTFSVLKGLVVIEEEEEEEEEEEDVLALVNRTLASFSICRNQAGSRD